MSKSYNKYGEKEKTYYYFIHLQLLLVICRKKQKQRPAKLRIHFTTELFWNISVFESNQRPKRYCFKKGE